MGNEADSSGRFRRRGGLLRVLTCATLVGLSFAAGYAGRRAMPASTNPDRAGSRTDVPLGSNSPAKRPTSRSADGPVGAGSDAAAASALSAYAGEFDAGLLNFRLWNALRAADEPAMAALLAQCETLPEGPARTAARGLLFRRWGEFNPAGALEALKPLDDAARYLGEGAIVRGWASVDPAAAFDWCLAHKTTRGSQPHNLNELVASLVETRRFAELAPRVSKLAEENSRMGGMTGFFNGMAFGEFVKGWAEDSPDAAYAWANALPAGRAKRDALFATVAGIAQDAPDLGLDYARSLPVPAERENAIAMVIARWLEQDPGAAESAIRSKLTGSERDEAFAMRSYATAATAPRGAIEGLGEIASASRRNRAAEELRRKFIRLTQLGHAAEVSFRWMPADQRAGAGREVFELWRRQDPAAAERFRSESPLLTPELRAALAGPKPPKS